MHEYGVALEIAERVFAAAAGRPVKGIKLHVGELSGIFSESLAMYLELIVREKQPDAPSLTVEPVRARFRCTCGEEYEPDTLFDPCRACGGFRRVVVAGNECTLESIEVDDD